MILRFATDLTVGFTSNQADYAEFGVMRTRRWMPWHAGEAAWRGQHKYSGYRQGALSDARDGDVVK